MAKLQEVRQKSFSDQRVELDNKHFAQCRFERCELVFAGSPVGLTQCQFHSCHWSFAGAAATTLALLTGLYHMGGDASGREMVEKIFADIRAKKDPSG